MKVQIEVIHPMVGFNSDGSNNIIDVEYNALTGSFNGSNKANWKNIIKLSGLPGSWTASFINPDMAEVYKIL